MALFAQIVWAADPVTTPGSISDTLRPATPLSAPPPVTVQTPDASTPVAPVQSSTAPTVTVKSFRLSGNTLYGNSELLPLLQGFIGRPLSIAQLYQAADVITAFYQHHGYTLTSVALPAQSVDGGVIWLQVIEGSIEKIEVQSKGYDPNLLRRYVRNTRTGDVYQTTALEDDLQTLNALPGVSSRAVLVPGQQFGSSDLVIRTTLDPIDVIGVVDNYGRKDVGEYRYSAGITLNDPFWVADQLQFFGVHSNTNRLNYGYVAYSRPLNSLGLRFDVDFGYAKFDVAPPFAVSGHNSNIDASLQQTLLRTSQNTLIGSAGYTHTSANADLTGVPLANTRLGVMTLGASYTHVWSGGAVTQEIASFHTNFRESSASERNRERARFEIDSQHLQPLFARFELLLHVDAEYSPDPLADTEQFSIGGPTSIRGFPPSEARGDRGFFGQITLRRAFAAGPVVIVPRVFGDTGVIRRLDLPAGTPNRDSMSSAGAGADIVYKKFSAKVDWSYPFDSKPTSDGRSGGRVYAALSAGF